MSSTVASNASYPRIGYRIGEWYLDPELRRLSRNGVSVQLEPKVMQVLCELSARAGEPVARETLHRSVWQDAFVGDDPLNRAISELRKVFGDNPRAPRYIETIHKFGYRLIALVETEPAASRRDGAPPLKGRVLGSALAACAAAVTVVGLFGAATHRMPNEAVALEPLRLVPVTSYPGRELSPALSPTRREVAYVVQSFEDGAALYMKRLDAEPPRRLIWSGQRATTPAWSSDGEHLVFTREGDAVCGVARVPRSGGPETELYACHRSRFLGVDVGPDDTLVVSELEEAASGFRLYLLRGEGRREPLTSPPPGRHDTIPKFSPDGSRVAFRRAAGERAHRLYWLSLDAPSRLHLVLHEADVAGFDWSVDGASLVASTNRSGTFGLWRLPLAGGDPEWIGLTSAYLPSTSPVGMAFEKRSGTVNIWRWDSDAPSAREGGAPLPMPFLSSTHQDVEPRYAPDGERVAFVSDRSGSYELWLLARDGRLERLTSFAQPAPGWIPSVTHPRWAPAGRAIVVSVDLGGEVDLYVVPATGGPARRLTQHPGEDRSPCWSADGVWIYFVSDREGDGAWSVWRIRPDGSSSARLLPANRRDLLECSTPGVLYQGSYAEGHVRRIRVPDDAALDIEVEDVSAPLLHPDWTLFDDHVVSIVPVADGYAFSYRGQGSEMAVQPLGALQPAGGAFTATGGISVSPDGRYALASVLESDESDIVFIDRFR